MNTIETLLKTLTTELVAGGADAVILFGSFARGDAAPYSDVDLHVLGDGRALYELRAGRLIVAIWTTPDAVRAAFRDPAHVGGLIPGWREARILHDPDGIAAVLQQAAHDWTWDHVDSAVCDSHVANEIAGYAEEAYKLVNALAAGRDLMAAVQRDVLALRLAGIIALRRRLLYGTENRLWDLIAAEMGDPWRSAQARAFGLGGELFEDTCRAALELYVLAANDARDLLDHAQRAIVDHACAAAGFAAEF